VEKSNNQKIDTQTFAEMSFAGMFIVGFVRGSHGISGEFKIESASGCYEHFSEMTEVTLRNGKTEESKKFSVEYVKDGGRDLYMKLKGIDSPEVVQKYNRWEILVPRDKACPLGENEWYVEDLKQCALVYEGKDGFGPQKVGTITDVMEGGSGDLLEVVLAEDCNLFADNVKYDSDGKLRTVYVPLKGEAGFIGKVDVKNKKIQLMHLWILE
jgi:16S rRNA processing protein RimM